MDCSYYPFEWGDDERMRVLMGPMPAAKDSVAYKGRCTFWITAMERWIQMKKGLCFTLPEAQMAFRRGTQIPICLPQVFEHLVIEGEIVPYNNLQSIDANSESWFNWSMRVFVSTPSRWAWNKLQETVRSRVLENTVFVNNKALQGRSDELYSLLWDTTKKNILTFDPEELVTIDIIFRNFSAPLRLKAVDDLNLVLNNIYKQGKVTILIYEGNTYIKFAKPGQMEPPIITQNEIAEHKLNVTAQKLNVRMTELQNQMDHEKLEAKRLLKEGSKKQALMLLKKKRRLENILERTSLAQDNVSSCLHQLQESKLNMDVIKSFQVGVAALKASLASTGTVEEVASDMEVVQEMLEECKEIGDTIAFSVTSGVEDEETLEEELKELMIDEAKENLFYKETLLPDVPTTKPFVDTREKEVKMLYN